MAIAEKDTRSPREQLEATIADLERERGELLAALTTAAERQEQARVDELVLHPERRSDSTGAASKPRKLAEQTRRDEERCSNIELELVAARRALSLLDAQEEREEHAARVKASQALRRREQGALDALRETAATFVAEFAVYEGIAVEQIAVNGGTADPELASVVPLQPSPELMLAFLLREEQKAEPSEPGTRPAPAPASAVVPVRRGDFGWHGQPTPAASAITR